MRQCAAVAWLAWILAGSPAALAEVDFDRQVRPILARRCAGCHGGDDPKAELSLTSRDGADHLLAPGKPEESELLRRVASSDPDERMPPHGAPLSAAEIDLLRRWIAAGADWPEHWAYAPLSKPPAPQAESDRERGWSRNPIDRFILERLRPLGLAPSPPAERRALLRRLCFDLIGLPPTPDEIAAFLADDSPDAYERVVDRLLASPHYGERWARHWMDLVHFAETHGHDQDRPREHSWPYRDYLIASLNQDKPYGRFVEEQVAGDALYPDDPWAIVATGLLAAGPWDESSLRDIREDSLDREVGRYLDRDDIVTTVMSTFTSSSVHCARCHDHKFDPITQDEYYGLQAIFAATDKANRAYDPDPAVAARRQELAQERQRIEALLAGADPALLEASLQEKAAAWEAEARAAFPWTPLEIVEARSTGGATLARQDDGSALASGPRPDKDVYLVTARSGLTSITGLRLDVLTDPSLPKSGPGRQDNGNLHLNELRVFVVEGDGDAKLRSVALANPQADFNQEDWTIAMALDENPNTAWGVFPEVGKPHWASFELKEPLQLAEGQSLRFELHQIHGGGHLIGKLRLSAASAPLPLPQGAAALPGEILALLAVDRAERSDEQRRRLVGHVLLQEIDERLAALPPRRQVYCGTNQFTADGSFRPAAAPRPVHVLRRGSLADPLREAVPQALACVEGLESKFELADPGDESQRRVALARWLSHRDNPLVWRSIANRLWQRHFGQGLVSTPNDFGRMGEAPSHPELLDWLAATLQEEGGSLKALHRRIVLSAAYQQSSASRPDGAAIDAGNRLVWRANRRRLDAESFRDALLVVSGSLDPAMGGPSAKQFLQTPGAHVTPNVDYLGFDVDDPANYRRSVYRFIFRTLPDPLMDALDCPDPSQLTPQRNVSVTALQALATLNDQFVVRQGERLAERIAKTESDADRQIALAYRLVLGRSPSGEEAAAVRAYADRHGLANACRFLLNTNEFLFVD